MSEKRRRTHSLLLNVGEDSYSIEFYDAALWGGADGLYRMRVNGAWQGNRNTDYSFVSLQEGVQAALRLFSGNPLFLDSPYDTPAPYLPEGSEVKVHYGPKVSGIPVYKERSWTKTPPQQDKNGLWYVWVWAGGKTCKVLCEDVEVVRIKEG